ncbi:MAG TPA: M3 family oligoendopeptidase, partial [Ktedonobacterales bacterium]|nr:M3 family oligoendopeptidase [Ktedonobacterales bacterium]
ARKQTITYGKLTGERSVVWEGKEIPIVQLYPVFENPDRALRERAFGLSSERVIQDTPALAAYWRDAIHLRHQIAANAGFDDYRAYRWRQLYRFDYTPDDAKRFHAAIEEVVIPAATRVNEQRRRALGVPTLRPWDLSVDPDSREPLHPYTTIDELNAKTSSVFHHTDPQFGAYFDTMRAEGLLDLDSRPNKASGGYSLSYNTIRRPFIFTNAVGAHDDVQTLLHEGGHSFHTFEMARLPYLQQRREEMMPMEFAEVASMGMELLASPYLTTQYGGFYTEAEAARARVDNLRDIIRFWPYMAMIDALQHWVYEHETTGGDDIEAVDDYWETLVDRFWPDQDWSGLDREKRTRWHRQDHVFTDPFYYIEYGMAQLGAVQVWGNALRDQAGAVAAYRRALALGGTVSLPELYATAGAKFAFDAETLRANIDLIERVIAELEPVARG